MKYTHTRRSNKFNLYSVNLEPDPQKEPKTELCAMKIRHFIIHFFFYFPLTVLIQLELLLLLVWKIPVFNKLCKIQKLNSVCFHLCNVCPGSANLREMIAWPCEQWCSWSRWTHQKYLSRVKTEKEKSVSRQEVPPSNSNWKWKWLFYQKIKLRFYKVSYFLIRVYKA